MNLTIDIGNTNSHLAVFKNNNIIFLKNLSNSLNKKIIDSLNNISKNYYITKIGISSVNPIINKSLIFYIKNKFKILPLTINYKTKLPLIINVKSKYTLGADRICNAVLANTYSNSKYNVLIIDFGTANTFDIVNNKNEFIGGIITTGLNTSLISLNYHTAKIPLYNLKSKNIKYSLIGKNTREAVYSGVFNSSYGTVNYIVNKLKTYFNYNLKIIISGGTLNYLDLNEFNFEYHLIENSVLKGINLILNYQK